MKKMQEQTIKRIQDLIVGGQSKIIEKKMFQMINSKNKQGNRVDLQKQLKNQDNFLGKILLKHSKKQCNHAIDIYKEVNKIYLLKTGQYLIKAYSVYLLFSQYQASYITQTKKGQYNGFKYKFDQYVYFGTFKIYNNDILFEQKGQLHKKQDCYIVYQGNWSQGNITDGEKIKYEGFQQHEFTQFYKGQFKDMKYNGYGIRKYKNTQKNELIDEGEFQCGAIVKKKK